MGAARQGPCEGWRCRRKGSAGISRPVILQANRAPWTECQWPLEPGDNGPVCLESQDTQGVWCTRKKPAAATNLACDSQAQEDVTFAQLNAGPFHSIRIALGQLPGVLAFLTLCSLGLVARPDVCGSGSRGPAVPRSLRALTGHGLGGKGAHQMPARTSLRPHHPAPLLTG